MLFATVQGLQILCFQKHRILDKCRHFSASRAPLKVWSGIHWLLTLKSSGDYVRYNIIHVNKDKYLRPITETRTRGIHDFREYIEFPSNDIYKFSRFPRTIREWNGLPSEIVSAESLRVCPLENQAVGDTAQITDFAQTWYKCWV